MRKFYTILFFGIFVLTNPIWASCPLGQSPQNLVSVLDEYFTEQATQTTRDEPTIVTITLPEHFKPTRPEFGKPPFRVGGAVAAPEKGPDYRGELEALGLILRYNQDPAANGGIRFVAMGTQDAIKRARAFVEKTNQEQKATYGDSAFVASVKAYQPEAYERSTVATMMAFAKHDTVAKDAFLPSASAEGLMAVKDQLDATPDEPYGQLTVLLHLKDSTQPIRLKLQGRFSHLSHALTLLAARESIVTLTAEKTNESSLVVFAHKGTGKAETTSSNYLSAPSVTLAEGQTVADVLGQKPLIEIVQ